MEIRRAGERRESLLHPSTGFCAQTIRAAVGASQSARVAELGASLDTVARSLALRARAFRGFTLENGERITPASTRFIGLWSPDGSITFERNPTGHDLAMECDCGASTETKLDTCSIKFAGDINADPPEDAWCFDVHLADEGDGTVSTQKELIFCDCEGRYWLLLARQWTPSDPNNPFPFPPPTP